MVATCLFWDGAAGAWSDSGCVKANTATRRTDGFVHCRCHHPLPAGLAHDLLATYFLLLTTYSSHPNPTHSLRGTYLLGATTLPTSAVCRYLAHPRSYWPSSRS